MTKVQMRSKDNHIFEFKTDRENYDGVKAEAENIIQTNFWEQYEYKIVKIEVK